MNKNCSTCLYKEGSCYPSTTIFDKDKTCKSYAPDYEGCIAELEKQIEKMKCCSNCDNWNWKHNKCEKKLKGDCFKHSKWVIRNF